ncbi:MAG: CopD family protein [Nitrospirales bacterium]|nr:CopD family protein [Nitrospira sp.]MDR4501703.1 CopD family protein [Nitrospirales bacterium]
MAARHVTSLPNGDGSEGNPAVRITGNTIKQLASRRDLSCGMPVSPQSSRRNQTEFPFLKSLTAWKSLQYSSTRSATKDPQSESRFSSMPLYLVIWIHLVAAITFIGGLLYVQLVLRPVLSAQSKNTGEAQDILKKTDQRFRTISWVSLIALIITGAFNMLSEGGSARIETAWGVVLMLKLFLFAIAFGLVLIHDLVLDPYAPSHRSSRPDASHPGHMTKALLVQRLILTLALVILLIATYLTTM